MAGTGIGTFNDRIRDAVRGGGPFDGDPRIQGFGSGQYTDPNGDPVNGSSSDQKAGLLHNMDLIKVGLTGNLKDYTFTDRTGATVTGAQVDYNGQPAGYTSRPAGGDQLRRRPRQRDPLRRADLQAAGGDHHGRPDPDADPVPGHHRVLAGRLVLANRVGCVAQQVLRRQQLRLRRLVQRARPIADHQRIRPRAAAQRPPTSGPTRNRCWPTPRSSPPRPIWPAPKPNPKPCFGSGRPARCCTSDRPR